MKTDCGTRDLVNKVNKGCSIATHFPRVIEASRLNPGGNSSYWVLDGPFLLTYSYFIKE